MKILLKHKIMLIFMLVIIVLLASLYFFHILSKTNVKDNLATLILTNNITIKGDDSYVTRFQLTGLIDEIDSDEVKTIKQYKKLLSTKRNRIIITANQMFELYYYSLPMEQRISFINNVSNKKVDISTANGAILISYN